MYAISKSYEPWLIISVELRTRRLKDKLLMPSSYSIFSPVYPCHIDIIFEILEWHIYLIILPARTKI